MKIELYFLLFILYSFLGWLMEVVCKSFQYKRFMNRGFLIGPYCPIYGLGSLLIIFLLQGFSRHIVILFLMSILICSSLEYFTSYIMEKIFRARWWDYSQKRLHINGRICFSTTIPFGILGCVIVYYINPFFLQVITSLPNVFIHVITFLLLVLFLVDLSVSFHFIYKIRDIKVRGGRDNTEEITKRVKRILIKKSGVYYRRMVNAYPNFKIAVKQKKDMIKQKLEQDIRIKKS